MSILLLLFCVMIAPGMAYGSGGGGTGDPVGTIVDGVEGVDRVTPSEEGVVLVEVPGIASSDFVARFVGDTIFVPYILLCDFLRIPNSVSADLNTITGNIPSGNSFELSRLRRTGRVGTDSFDIDPTAIRMIYGEVFVELTLFSRLIDLSTRLDLERLTLIIEPSPRLPLVQWNQSRRRMGTIQNEEEPASRLRGRLYRTFAGSPILDWSISNYLTADRTSTSAYLRLGAEVLYGALELNGSLTTREDGSLGAALDGGVWRYSLPDFAPLRQITLGRVLINSQIYTGIELSNVPVEPAQGFGSHQLTGYSQPGWMVEMYEAGQLVDMAQADSLGAYRFYVPMGYGTIDRTLRHVGPFGEVQIERRRLQLNPLIVPAGDLYYTATMGAEDLSAGSAIRGKGTIDFGVADFLSIGAESQIDMADTRSASLDSIRPAAVANLWLGESLSLGLRYMPAMNSASSQLFWISPDNIVLRGGVDSLVMPTGTFVANAGGVLPVGNFSLGASARYHRRADGNSMEIVPNISGYIDGLSFTASTAIVSNEATGLGELAIDSTRPAGSIQSHLQLISTPLPGIVLMMQGRYDHTARMLGLMQISSYFRVSDLLGVTVGWDLPALNVKQSSLQLQLSLDLGFSRGVVTSSLANNLVSTASLLQGSVLVSPGGVKMLPDFSVGQAAILLRAFYDRNNNGRRDDGEENLAPPAALLRLAGMEMETEDGRFYQLPPNRECEVEVDRWCHTEIGVFPSTSRYSLYTGSSSQQVIDIPFVEGFDVSGSCTLQKPEGSLKISALNGLRIELVSTATGSRYEGEIYSDGSIYIPSVGAGTYTIKFDEAQLTSRHLKVVSMPGSVDLSRENDRLTEVVFGRR